MITLAALRGRVQAKLRDTDSHDSTFVIPEYDQAIADMYLQVAGMLPAHCVYTASGLTISASSNTFTLPATVAQYTGAEGGAEYTADVHIQIASTGTFLKKISMEEMRALLAGKSTTTPSYGVPYCFALYEDKSQVVQAICDPGAKDATVCNLYASMDADDLRDFVGTGAQNLDNVEVRFSRLAAEALALHSAAELLLRMSDEDVSRRKLNRQVARKWMGEADALMYADAARRHDLESSGRTERWVP